MQLRRLIPKILVALVALAGFSSVSFTSLRVAHADNTTIIPPRFDLFGNPGDTIAEKVKVVNQSTENIQYSTQVDNFTANGDDGGVAILDPSTPSTSYALAKWITVEPANFTVNAGETTILNVQIKVPKTGEPGGHYASVLIKRSGQASPGGASVDTRIGSLILLRVSGSVTESMNIDSFAPADSFAQYGPVTFNMKLNNSGNVHVAPKGTIVITNMFNKKVAEIPVTSSNVLPGSSRVISSILEQKNLVGRYTATLVATYGDQNQSLSATTTFYVFPFYLLWIGLGVILFIVFILTQRKNLKRAINRLTSD
jgi:Bacterial protein of unknown function (DUF916)